MLLQQFSRSVTGALESESPLAVRRTPGESPLTMRPHLLFGLLAVWATVGCNAASAVDSVDDFIPDVPTDFQISISSGTSPTISWPGGKASSLSIVCHSCNTITEQTSWSFSAQSNAGFASPVTYGKVPSGYRCGIVDDACPNATGLRKGGLYQIVIFRVDGRIGSKVWSP